MGSTLVVVEHPLGGTRLRWACRSRAAGHEAAYEVTVWNANPPLPSVELLVADRGPLDLG